MKNSLVQSLRAILQQSKSGSYALARQLAKLHDAYPGAFQTLITEGHVKRRRAYLLARVGRVFAAANIDDKELGSLGWTKVSVLAPHLTADNKHELITLAHQSTVAELKQGLGKGPGKHVRYLILSLSTEDYDHVSAALIERGAVIHKSGVKGGGAAMLAILDELKKLA